MSGIDIDKLLNCLNRFPKDDLLFLQRQIRYMSAHKPLRGLKVIHSVHITYATICKLIPLLLSGATVDVTAAPPLITHKDALGLLIDAGVNVVEVGNIQDDYDISLDCCASLKDVVHPRLGAVELTQTGAEAYKLKHQRYPVFSIDDTLVKNIENFYGTGDGFLRALLELIPGKIENKKFMVFGYGKVGHGVVFALSKYTRNIVVIEKEKERIDQAAEGGLKAYFINEIEMIKNELQDTYCVVTATGIHGVLSRHFSGREFSKVSYFANIGSQDEFGDEMTLPSDKVLTNKQPINFSLEEPTRVRFLDPIFYLHNQAAVILKQERLPNEVLPYPFQQDEEIAVEWSKHHSVDIAELRSLYQNTRPISIPEKMVQENAYLRDLLEHVPCYLYWKDVNSVYLGCNRLFAEAAGLSSPDEIIGKTDFDLAWGKTEANIFRNSDLDVLQKGVKINFEEPQRQANGETWTVLASKAPMYDQFGRIIGILGTYVNVTDQKEAERLRLENRINEERIEAARMLAATVAHELRTPLVSINMAAHTIKNSVDTLIEAYQYAKEHGWAGGDIPINKFKLLPQVFDNIGREVEYSNLFINMLLMNIQELQIQKEDLKTDSLQQYIAQAVSRYPFTGVQRERLHVNTGIDFEVQLVPLLFEHLMFNLIKNGLYYIDAAGKGKIDIWLEKGEKFNLMYFQDGGRGIPADQLENIFKRFYTNRRQGTGVGLNFCKQVMTQLGGDIRCESEEGQFTRFILEFPVLKNQVESNK